MRNIRGVVLSVGVQDRDPTSPRRLDAGQYRHALSATRPMPDDPDLREVLSLTPNLVRGRLAAPVIDVNDFVLHPAVERAPDFRHQRRHVGRLVARRYHHRKVHSRRWSANNPREAGGLTRFRAPTNSSARSLRMLKGFGAF